MAKSEHASSLSANPVLVEVTRGEVVESLHRGAAVVVDAAGRVVAAWGQVERAVYPRSALKPIQALALLESGAADAFGLGAEEIALAAASHGGEPEHVERVRAWLARLGLGPQALECGTHPPANAEAAAALVRAGSEPSALHNNCSGKHAGFLTVARHLGVDPRGYIRPDHPVQRLVGRGIEEMAGAVLAAVPCGVDGCGIPVYALKLSALATAMARLAAPEQMPLARGQAARRIVQAMIAHPRLVAGRGRLCSEVMEAAPRLAIKGGAEGVYAAIVPERGLGIAVKIDDGAGRAAEVAVMAVLVRLGLLSRDEQTRLAPRLQPALLNAAGRVVGALRPAAEWAMG
jgi:L-asparaginase II